MKPIIFLAFANDREDHTRYLRNIPEEYNAIRKVLLQAQQDGLCEVEMLPYSSFEDIHEIFTRKKYRNRIAVFHFSGHADGFQLLLENAKGETKTAYGSGISEYFSVLKSRNIQKNLKILFFNGCCTENFALRLQPIFPCVIATKNEILDEEAKAISIDFYQNLCRQIQVGTAFDLAKSQRHIDKGNQIENFYRALYRKTDQKPKSEPWEIWANDEGKTWKLRKDRKALIFSIIAFVVLLLAYPLYKICCPDLPFAFTVKVKELHQNPNLPFENGKISLQIGDKTEMLEILKEQPKKEAIFQQIPPNLKNKAVKMVFEAEGYVKIDSSIVLENDFAEIGIRRDESLAKVFGLVTYQDKPVENAEISVQDLTTKTDQNGKFEIKIPFAKQLKKQRIRANKQGFQLWDYENPVVGEEVKIVLEK